MSNLFFDIETYARQYLPPAFRKPRIIGIVRVLFAPIVLLVNALKEAYDEAILRVRATSQVAVLAYLCNRALGHPNGVGPVYVLDGNFSSFDIQVVVPTDVPPVYYQALIETLERHLLPGVRYRIRIDSTVSWADTLGDQPDLFTFRFVVPVQIINNKLRFGIAPVGQYTYQIFKDGTLWINQSAPVELRPETYLEFPQTGTLPAGFYRVVVNTLPDSGGQVKELEGSISTNGETCSLGWTTLVPAVTVERTNDTDALGNRKYNFTLNVWSNNSSIAPFKVETRLVGATSAESGYTPVSTNPLVFSLYRSEEQIELRVVDKNGCRTPWIRVDLPNQAANCDLAFEVLNASVVNGAYRVTITLYSARPNLAPFGYEITKSDNSAVTSGTSTTNPIYVTLPLSMGAIPLRVRASDSQGCKTSWQTLTLPNPPTGGGETAIGDAVVLTYTPSGVMLADGKHRVLNSDGTIGAEQSAPANLQPATLKVVKPVDMTYSTANGVVDFTSYSQMTWGDGFIYANWRRYLPIPWNDHFRQQQRTMVLTMTPQEMETERLGVMRKAIHEIGGNVLAEYQPGEVFCFTPIAAILGKLRPRNGTIMDNVAQIQLNWEQSFPRRFSNLSEFQEVYPNAAQTVITCESNALRGQQRTLRQVWDAGLYDDEVNQRLTNRLVATIRFLKQESPQARVASGDVCYTVAGAEQDEFVNHANATHPGSFEQYLWDQRANFDPVVITDPLTNSSITVRADNKTYFEVADFLNVYAYPDAGRLEPADFDALYVTGTNRTYAFMMEKGQAPKLADLSLAGIMEGNRRKLDAKGLQSMPITSFFHYRYENGYTRGSDYNTRGIFIGPAENRGDGAILPPYHAHIHAAIVRMCMREKVSGLSIWSTQKGLGPNQSPDAVASYDRPQGEQSAFAAGLDRLYQFKEYFEPTNSPVFDYRPAVKFAISKGFTWNTEDAGDGYRRYNPGSHSNPNNNDDVRTKALVLTRVIKKNGAYWALVLASNMRQGATDVCSFTVKFARSQYAGLSGDVVSPTLSFTGGRDVFVTEFCLNPSALDTSGTGTTGGGGTGGGGGDNPLSPFVRHDVTKCGWGLQNFHYGTGGMDPNYLELYNHCRALGSEVIFPAFYYTDMVPTFGAAPNFTTLDAVGDWAKANNTRMGIRIATWRSADKWAGFFTDSDRMRDEFGRAGTRSGAMMVALQVAAYNNLVRQFLIDTAMHIKGKSYAPNVYFFSVVNGGLLENEYASSLAPDGGDGGQFSEVAVTLDYSESARVAFIIYMQQKFTLAQVNARWSTNYNAWSDVQLPRNRFLSNGQPIWPYNNNYMKDFYGFRVRALAGWTNDMLTAIRSVAANVHLVNEHGSAFDRGSQERGTPGVRPLITMANGNKCNNDPNPNEYPPSTTMALNLGLNGELAFDEVWFGGWAGMNGPRYTVAELIGQGVGDLRAGANGLACAGSLLGDGMGGNDMNLSKQRLTQWSQGVEAQRSFSLPAARNFEANAFDLNISRILNGDGWGASGAKADYAALTQGGTKLIKINEILDV